MDYCSAARRNRLLPEATVWMNLESFTLNERSQTQNTTYCMIPCTGNPRKGTTIVLEST